MNSGELDLNTRRNVTFAPGEAGAAYPAQARRQAAPINRKNRRRKVFIASIRCAAARFALCGPFEFQLFQSLNLPPHRAFVGWEGNFCPEIQSASALVPPADGTEPPRERPPHPRAPA